MTSTIARTGQNCNVYDEKLVLKNKADNIEIRPVFCRFSAAAAAAMHLHDTVVSAGRSYSSETKRSQFIVRASFRLISGQIVADISKMLKIVKLCHP